MKSIIILEDETMNNVDMAMNFGNVINIVAVLLLMRAVIKDRNKLIGFSVSGTLLTLIAMLGFETGFYLMGNYFSFGLGILPIIFWFMVFVFNFRNFIQKRKGSERK